MSKPKRRPAIANIPRQHAYPNPRRFPWISTLVAAVVSVALFTGVAGAIIVDNLHKQVGKQVLDMSQFDTIGGAGAPTVSEGEFEGRAVNLLFIGVDSRAGDNEQIGSGSADDVEGARSDINIVLHISADRQHATLISIPRDLMVDMPGCPDSDGWVYEPQYIIFNAVYGLGVGLEDPAAGVNCTKITTEQVTGVPIDGFVLLDFIGFERIIDAFGGVELYLDQDMQDHHSGIDLKAGLHKLDGRQSLQYARVRYGVLNEFGEEDGSDIYRMGRQQQLIGALLNQVMDSNLLTDLPKLLNFAKEAMSNVQVSESLSSLNTDVGLLNSLRNVPRENFLFLTTPWQPAPEDENRVIENQPLADEVWMAILNDSPLPPGTTYKNVDNEVFIVGDDGIPILEASQSSDPE